MAGKGIAKPTNLAQVPLSAVFALCEGSLRLRALAVLWIVARSSLKEGTSADHLIQPHKFLTCESLTQVL